MCGQTPQQSARSDDGDLVHTIHRPGSVPQLSALHACTGCMHVGGST